MKKEILIILLLLLISFPAVRSLLLPGGYTSHDLTHHIVRQIDMDRLFSEGQFPPRWSGELNNGYGYPLFLFNYPLPAMLGELFHKSGLGFVDSVKAVLFSSMLMSVIGMYLFLNKLLGVKLAAFLGAVFYLYAPMRFSIVYVSASVGSALALGILPFVFLAILQRSAVLGSLSLAALILAHNVTALIFAPAILAFGLFVVKKIKITLTMLLMGLGLSAWFFLPAVWEKHYLVYDNILFRFWKDHFPSFWQLVRSPWGYGFSMPGTEKDAMSFQIGLIHIGVIIVLSLLFIVRRIKNKNLGIFVLITFFAGIFLMLKISYPLWDNLPFLSLVQFPWRLLSVVVFMASIGTALLVKHLPFKKLLSLVLLLLVIYANRNHWNVNEKYDPGEDYYSKLKVTSTMAGEHLPKWGRIMDKIAPSKLEFISGIGKVNILQNKSARVLAEVEATTSGKLKFNQFYFPGWNIKIDNKQVNFNYLIDGESYGLPVFDIDAGKHKVLAEFNNTTVRNLADTISAISVIVWLLILCRLLILRK